MTTRRLTRTAAFAAAALLIALAARPAPAAVISVADTALEGLNVSADQDADNTPAAGLHYTFVNATDDYTIRTMDPADALTVTGTFGINNDNVDIYRFSAAALTFDTISTTKVAKRLYLESNGAVSTIVGGINLPFGGMSYLYVRGSGGVGTAASFSSAGNVVAQVQEVRVRGAVNVAGTVGVNNSTQGTDQNVSYDASAGSISIGGLNANSTRSQTFAFAAGGNLSLGTVNAGNSGVKTLTFDADGAVSATSIAVGSGGSNLYVLGYGGAGRAASFTVSAGGVTSIRQVVATTGNISVAGNVGADFSDTTQTSNGATINYDSSGGNVDLLDLQFNETSYRQRNATLAAAGTLTLQDITGSGTTAEHNVTLLAGGALTLRDILDARTYLVAKSRTSVSVANDATSAPRQWISAPDAAADADWDKAGTLFLDVPTLESVALAGTNATFYGADGPGSNPGAKFRLYSAATAAELLSLDPADWTLRVNDITAAQLAGGIAFDLSTTTDTWFALTAVHGTQTSFESLTSLPLEAVQIPEPATLGFLAVGGLAMIGGAVGRRRRRG